jgi:hypothetical protein
VSGQNQSLSLPRDSLSLVADSIDQKEATAQALRDLASHFVVPTERELRKTLADRGTTLPDHSTTLREPFGSASLAFFHSLESVYGMVLLPYAIAHIATLDQFRRGTIASELVLAWKLDELSTDERRAHAIAEAEAKHDAFTKSPEGALVISRAIAAFLINGVTAGFLGSPASHLVEQGVVLLWSALEVMARDVFRAVVDESPTLALALASEPTTRRRFQVDKIPLEILAENSFNVSQTMGTILAAQQDFSDLTTIKAVFSVLSPNDAALRDALAAPDLWQLCQRRHLLVHRRGIVDAAYLRNTGEPLDLGSRIRVSPDDFERYFHVVMRAGVSMELTADSWGAESPAGSGDKV